MVLKIIAIFFLGNSSIGSHWMSRLIVVCFWHTTRRWWLLAKRRSRLTPIFSDRTWQHVLVPLIHTSIVSSRLSCVLKDCHPLSMVTSKYLTLLLHGMLFSSKLMGSTSASLLFWKIIVWLPVNAPVINQVDMFLQFFEDNPRVPVFEGYCTVGRPHIGRRMSGG